jgi:hypothetical protein
MQNSLMSMLAGDFMIQFQPGFSMHLHFRKLLEESKNGLQCVVDDAYFRGAAGARFASLKGGLWPFFLTLDVTEIEETETHIHQRFIVDEERGTQFAHRGFPALFMGKGGRWRKRLEEHQFTVRPEDMWEAAREAGHYSAIKGLMRIVPQHVPAYLEKVKTAISASGSRPFS